MSAIWLKANQIHLKTLSFKARVENFASINDIQVFIKN